MHSIYGHGVYRCMDSQTFQPSGPCVSESNASIGYLKPSHQRLRNVHQLMDEGLVIMTAWDVDQLKEWRAYVKLRTTRSADHFV